MTVTLEQIQAAIQALKANEVPGPYHLHEQDGKLVLLSDAGNRLGTAHIAIHEVLA